MLGPFGILIKGESFLIFIFIKSNFYFYNFIFKQIK